jgi:hypothetical protein
MTDAPSTATAPATATSITTLVDYSKDPAYMLRCVKTYLRCKVAELNVPAKSLAVVFDIDETLLYHIESTDELALQPVGRALYTHCKDAGFRIVFVTARLGDPASLDYVQKQLKALDYECEALFMVSKEHEQDECPSVCKLRSRLELGCTVVLNVGNRCSDLFATDHDMDPVLASLNAKTYYAFAGVEPDLLCLKLPTDCPLFSDADAEEEAEEVTQKDHREQQQEEEQQEEEQAAVVL